MDLKGNHKIIQAVKSTLGDADTRRIFIVGFSGGADSVALLAAMHECGYNVIAAHCNFQLRGEESLRDENHARQIAGQLDVPFMLRRFDTRKLQSHSGGSIEMVCRRLRYDWFGELIDAYSAEAVAIAHHGDDNVETLLLNLFRGTGIAGLTAMRSEAKQPVRVIRPLLQCTRNDILQYLAERDLRYVTDSTNLSSDYRRNAIRNIIMPAIRQSFPNADKAIADTISHLQQAEDFMRRQLDVIKSKYFIITDGVVNIHIARLIAETQDPAFILHELLTPYGFTDGQITDIMNCVRQQVSGRVFKAAAINYILDRGILRPCNSENAIASTESIAVVTERVSKEYMTATPGLCYFNPAVLEGTPLNWRFWSEGDRMRPFGMKGTRKLSDIFRDAKIPNDHKHRLPLLVKGDTILWIPGIRRSMHYPVMPDDSEIILVKALAMDFKNL